MNRVKQMHVHTQQEDLHRGVNPTGSPSLPDPYVHAISLSRSNQVIYTFFKRSMPKTSPVRRSLTWPSKSPALRAYSSSRALP